MSGPAHWDAESVGELLLSVVAERTGYPVEILNVDMELDTDLGVDSIKKVEILSAVRERVGDLPSGELSALAGLRTLRAIAERVSGPATPTGGPPASAPAAGTVPRSSRGRDPEPGGEAVPGAGVDLSRQVMRAVEAPRSGLAMLGLTGHPLVVTDDGQGVAPLVVERLAGHGIQAEVVAEVPPGATGVILLDGLRPVASIDEALAIGRTVFRAARTVAAQMANPRMAGTGGVFVTVQDTGGDFGIASAPADPVRAWLGGIVGLTRTVAREWPGAAVKAIDCAGTGRGPGAVAGEIVTELLRGGGAAEVGLPAGGTRVVPVLTESPVSTGESRIGPHSVVVATGGARGVTALAIRLLAERYRPRLVLLGRTPLTGQAPGLAGATDEPALVRLLAGREPGTRTPAQVTAAAREILAVREIQATLDACRRSGAEARYARVDVRDEHAVRAALAPVRRDWGPVTAIVHGAGVLADALVADKTDEQFDRVFGTKVMGLRALLAATAGDPLAVVCAFSSVAAVFGNAGQADYAMANEVLGRVLAGRSEPVARVIAWGPWRGGMVTPELAGRFAGGGVPLIDPDAGARAFLADLADPSAGPVVVRAAGGGMATSGGTGLAGELTVTVAAYPYLADHLVGGVPVVPVATVLDWFARAARALRPGNGPVVVRDLRVLDKIAVPAGGRRLVLRGQPVTAGDGPALDLDLRDDAGRPHYRGSVAGTPPPPARSWPAPTDLAPVGDVYDGVTLFHGPRLRVLRGTPGASATAAEAVVSGGPGDGAVDVPAVDGALQLAVLWARRAGAGTTLPMAVRECRLYRPGAGEYRCVVRGVRAGDSAAECDVALLDPDGVPRLELLGVQLVRRPGG